MPTPPARVADLLQPRADEGAVARALQAMRSHLNMEVAYVSEFVDGRSVFRAVDAPGLEEVVKVGDSHSLDDVYCRHILAGRLPQVMPDTSLEPLAMSLPITEAAGIRSHISVPIIRKSSGEPYGMFCCVGFHVDPSLNGRDLQMMNAFAELASFEINREMEEKEVEDEKRIRIRDVIDGRKMVMAYQPIWDVGAERTVGLEALSRFIAEPRRTPDLWFTEAAEAGLGAELELMAIRLALEAFDADLPPHVYIAVNASPDTILAPDFVDLLMKRPAERVVLEITEHAHVADYDLILATLAPLRARGVRLAVDDAGAGYSSLQHILQLQPDIIKLDMGLTRHVDIDPGRRALASALIGFSKDTGSQIIAEGVETDSELRTLRELGATRVQGYFLGRPMSLPDVLKMLRVASRRRA